MPSVWGYQQNASWKLGQSIQLLGVLMPHNKRRCDEVIFNHTGILLVLEVLLQLL
jgi:lipid A disaccharide synthetase